MLRDAERIDAATVAEHVFGCLSLFTIYFCVPNRYEKVAASARRCAAFLFDDDAPSRVRRF